MIRLTPLAETVSGQELLKEERVMTLTALMRAKFAISEEVLAAIAIDLQKLDLNSLKALIEQILHIETLEQLEQWLAEHQPTAAA
jgi:phosphoenolpyruvate-protein kinase (PTS system EI component)